LSPSSSQTGSFALILGEEFGPRRLPIIIGMFEAQAIAIEIEKIEPNRPMTHDLFKSFARTFHYSVSEISITDIKEGVFLQEFIVLMASKILILMLVHQMPLPLPYVSMFRFILLKMYYLKQVFQLTKVRKTH